MALPPAKSSLLCFLMITLGLHKGLLLPVGGRSNPYLVFCVIKFVLSKLGLQGRMSLNSTASVDPDARQGRTAAPKVSHLRTSSDRKPISSSTDDCRTNWLWVASATLKMKLKSSDSPSGLSEMLLF